ncbi:MAG: hypothetical protein LKJ17_12050 [Oscillospiraceae bacterium]|jgi:hypothetical protein|nr:hypothetical protein [Oscillospiraceae bacterium]
MTADDLKRLDKRIRQIQDPFGTGFQSLMGLGKDYAKNHDMTIYELGRRYVAWKRGK